MNCPRTAGGFSPSFKVKYAVTASCNASGSTLVGMVPFSPGAGDHYFDALVFGSGSFRLHESSENISIKTLKTKKTIPKFFFMFMAFKI